MPPVSPKNFALQSAAASDLGLGGLLADDQEQIANALKKKKEGDGSLSSQLAQGGPFMGWGGAGTRQMYGAAGLDLGITAY
jgi:hypothetical protein